MYKTHLIRDSDTNTANTRYLLEYHGSNMEPPRKGPCYDLATTALAQYCLIDQVCMTPSVMGLNGILPVNVNAAKSRSWTEQMVQGFKGWDEL
ncbi:hypothetical protein JR316_0012098 [Psilocybe cubensis]|uniref:Uncharacterized protein n=1 Tax=Psilocybe cubensis TaxID=181762 RepID=A0ACB8GHB6_PSICU|nr:hypothetical protein JR316_0012098 [Psilocybe cubensis]KAH9474999.1 hypothetical protein JR316_0012098 [Psilocybe cubensis]